MTSSNNILLAAIVLVCLAHSGFTQRSSPQFSIPAGGSQFGTQDIFASNNGQDVSGQTANLQFNLDKQSQQSAPSGLGQPQSGSASVPSAVSAGSSVNRQPESQSSSFLRPNQQNSAQRPQQAAQPNPFSGSTIGGGSSSGQSAVSQQSSGVSSHQSSSIGGGSGSRGSQTQTSGSSISAASVAAPSSSQRSKNIQAHHHVGSSSSSASSASHHHQTQHNNHANAHNLHGLQTQITSQALHAQNNPGSIEIARKTQATAASIAAASGQAYQCPDSFGYFRHHKSCDKYWACENGTATLKLCGNGLNFDDSDPKRENCAYPFSVDCGTDRTELEAPISTPNCPRLYGLYPDNTNCRVFYSCWNGESSKYECPPGLAYDNEQRVCVWADLVDRCDSSEVSDGFVCPDPTEADQPGHYTRHAHPTDCRKFYVCIEGVARPYGCSLGTVFNVDSLQCDEPDNVSGCEKYYGDLDPKVAKKLAREGAQASNSNQPPASSAGSAASGSQSGSNARSPKPVEN